MINDDIKIFDAYQNIKAKINAACTKAGRSHNSIELVAVTKFHSAETVELAYKAGMRSFGENRVQEAEQKFSTLSLPDSKLYLLGPLQRNKVKKALSIFDCVQSVDSEVLLLEINKRAEQVEKVFDVLFELHTGEDSKIGFSDKSSLFKALELSLSLPYIRPRGLMTMAPYTQNTELIRSSFKLCRSAFDEAKSTFSFTAFDTVSMGMTNDFEIAIEEGSTMVRIGTAIFGTRSYQNNEGK